MLNLHNNNHGHIHANISHLQGILSYSSVLSFDERIKFISSLFFSFLASNRTRPKKQPSIGRISRRLSSCKVTMQHIIQGDQ